MYSKRLIVMLIAGAVLCALLAMLAARRPYFPGDVAIARAIQAALPGSVGWAKWTTSTAEAPACFVLLVFTMLAAWLISGWRSAIIAVPVFFGLFGFGLWLSPLVAQPRPSPTLITVVGHPKGFSFPSIFGLIYAATFGYVGVVALVRQRGAMRSLIPALAVLALIAGLCARVVLGAHWPSDLWSAYLMGLVWIGLLVPFSKNHSPNLA
jgi:membrane-associated phospholipid phosphatase